MGADTECVEEHLPLVVGRPARVETVLADDGVEGVAVPAVLAGGGLYVVVAVDEDRRRLRVPEGHSAKTAGAPGVGQTSAVGKPVSFSLAASQSALRRTSDA
ncbi:hypothetical protein STENM327S_05371 [Streptomyces tendae]